MVDYVLYTQRYGLLCVYFVTVGGVVTILLYCRAFNLVSRLELLTLTDIKTERNIPNDYVSSDHQMLMARFAWK